MRSNKKRNIMPDAIGYIDDDIVSGVLSKIDKENKTVYRPRKRGVSSWAAVAVAIAACAVLLAFAIPTTTTIINDINLFSPVGAAGESEHIEKSKFNGSPGLLYKINEDGKSAAFVGYGSCTDETVYIASTYEGLPVTVMYNKEYESPLFTPYNQSDAQNVKHLVIPDTVKYIHYNCISQCPYIESVYFGASVENIRGFNFHVGYGVNFSKVEVSPDNPYYSDKGNCIVDLRTKALVLATPWTVIPDDGSVEIIGMMAFAPARYWLDSIVIPEGVKIIDHFAFSGCEQLESVIFPDSLEVIEYDTFTSCKKLKNVELGTNLIAVDCGAFPYTHKISYKGTVDQWKAVIKTNVFAARKAVVYEIVDGERIKLSDSEAAERLAFNVICTDGVSNSAEGKKGTYNWRFFPEYEEYYNRWKASNAYYVFGPDGTFTKIMPWEIGGQ